MNLEEIKQELQKVLQEEYEDTFERLKTYYKMILDYDIFRSHDDDVLHPATLLLASLSVKSPDTYYEKTNQIEKFMEKSLLNHFWEFSAFFIEFEKLEKKNQEKIMKCFHVKGMENLVSILDTLKNENKEENCELTLNCLSDYLKVTPADLDEITPLMEMIYHLKKEEKESFYFFAYYSILLYELEEDPHYSIHKFPKEEADFLRRNYNEIVDKYRSLEKEEKQERKNFIKKQSVCKNLLKKLEYPFQGYLRLTEEEIKYLPATILDDIESIYLKWNENILENIEKELEIYNGNKEEKLRDLFQKYAIPFFQKKEHINFLNNKNMEEIEEKLNVIKNYFQNVEEEDLFSLLCMDMNCFKTLMPYFITNIITIPFFIQNMSLLQKEEVLKQMEKNYKFLKSYSLNCKTFNEILFVSDEVLEQMIQKLESDHLPITEIIVKSSFLPNFFEVYEIWKEKGIENFFVPNLSVLENDLVGITKRILLCLSLQIPVFDENGSLNTLVTSQNKFFMEDKEMDAYLDHHSVQKLTRNFSLHALE